ncbi:putative polyketide synthase [Aspergillus homomorphus CBS 101889]|uniref:Putative polyketide synthase n=1 Tax=Aspergillus homomorphus (strain CBS 101889) TaxID=1450537 RepID=A0A395HP44_ASPHC|nr:putative polyketide synthase [Aspergillus homomorphus CBS 101889]RAL09587.1 putative polyketide synthase [Aspergillus homomorphus CBS 101889]
MALGSASNTHSAARSRLLLFGPQALGFTKQSFQSLLRSLSDSPLDRRWVLDLVAELRAHWPTLAKQISTLQWVRGEKLLAELEGWFMTSSFPETNYDLPNILLTPLVVLSQLGQCWQYFSVRNLGNDMPLSGCATLGFCTGILSAFAVSSSKSLQDLPHYAAVAVRLAMLIGALVDAQEASDTVYGPAKSFAIAWTSTEQGTILDRIIDQFPEAYISVLYDTQRATVTISQHTASLLVQQLHAAGMVASEVGLQGRFHCRQYEKDLETVLRFCDSEPRFQFPDASQLALPSYTNTDGQPLVTGRLHHLALRAVLVEQCNWYKTFTAVQSSVLQSDSDVAVSFGPSRSVPPSLVRQLGARLVQAPMIEERPEAPQFSASVLDPKIDRSATSIRNAEDDDIAIVGMSIRVAGADDVAEFWDLNRRGESQHTEVPTSRFGFQTQWREVDERKWYGNFIRDVDAFDHKFFKRSPREAATMDPQQRLMLQAAYQAVEQSGYFAQPNPDNHIGCYIGACAADYEHNVACYPPNAFTATGNLKSFIPGKVAHYFGWTGPGMTIDTACSASAVAIHTACRAILSGECTGGALAGGVATMSNPIWFQNLAGATFLSPTGQCKPFDEKADGYCRGEGIACVFLKKMSRAIADGNQIFGCIASTAVLQNENCTPLFVPNSPSLSHLFREVVRKARLEPEDISFVEAHGTGTPVGDPAEYESIRLALAAGAKRTTRPLQLGSVKGLVGHTEGTSGVISLIKAVLMLQEGFIPPQASHSKLSHHIAASEMIEIPTTLRRWDEPFKAALINNYGASGSNASMVITQFTHGEDEGSTTEGTDASDMRYPFWIPGFDDQAISAYCRKLLEFIITSRNSNKKTATLANIAFSVSRQSNRSLPRGLIFSCSSLANLEDKLQSYANGRQESSDSATLIKPARPVILCFGGQVSTFVGLDKAVYEQVKIFRSFLDRCDAMIRSLGLPSILPAIFQRTPVNDPVQLQTMLFAMQYSCAKCWMDCGIVVAAVVGHSFGELTALCVSGALSLRDTLNLVAGRAKLIRDAWGDDSGAMVAVEGDPDVVQQLIVEANRAYAGDRPASIACYNGPRSFTLAGSTRAIDVLLETVSQQAPTYSSIRTKRLNVTNAFHSVLVDPLVPSLESLGEQLAFKRPLIPLHRSTEAFQSPDHLTTGYVAQHMRQPVFFDHAVQRLRKEHPSCVWLEAGSNSTITVMAKRAVGGGGGGESHFQAMDLCSEGAMQKLSDATASLWQEGLRVSLWGHHALQASDYAPLILPPYQFEKHRHWLELKVPQSAVAGLSTDAYVNPQHEVPVGLWTFTKYCNAEKTSARFRINTMTDQYKDLVSGHLIAQTAPICPATLQVDMAIEALRSLRPELAAQEMQPQLLDMQNQVPVCVDPSRLVWLDCTVADPEGHTWAWQIVSNHQSLDAPQQSDTVHVAGKIRFCSSEDPQYQAEFARYERMVAHKRCLSVLESGEAADDIIQGRNIYRTFAEIVDYGEVYRGVKKVVGKGDECAGRVCKAYTGETWLDTLLADCFSQVAGIWVNCMTDRAATDLYIASGCELLMRSPKVRQQGYAFPETWDVFAAHHRQSEKMFLTDVFVFDATTGALVLVMLGIHYMRVSKVSMSKILTRLTAPEALPAPISKSAPAALPLERETVTTAGAVTQPVDPQAKRQGSKKPQSSRPDLSKQVREIIANVSGLEASEIKNDSNLADFGIDSLMGMELAREVETVFKCTLDQVELMEATDFRKFVKCIAAALHLDEGDEGAVTAPEGDEEDSTGSETSTNGHETPRTTLTVTPPGETADDRDVKAAVVQLPSFPHPLDIPAGAVLAAFAESKLLTDNFIRDYRIDNFADTVMAKSTQLCVALVVEAFEELGCPLRTATAGQVLDRIPYEPQHHRLVGYLYELLEKDARLIDREDRGERIVRTAIAPPKKPSETILEDLLRQFPEWVYALKLTSFAGKHLAAVLQGKTDGIRVIFGTPEGRELVSALYCDHSFNRMSYHQMKDFISRLIARLPAGQGPLKILEMGAGTGGTTQVLVPFLASLDIPVEYTFTDLAPSMVALARRKYKSYPFMRFGVHDIEQPPADELRNQHIVIASNAVHATHSLTRSAENIRAALRPDGFLMMLEMTEIVPFIDIIFGLLEGWWLFEDGRQHAIAPPSRWERDLQSVGFGHVDWTDGRLPENDIQKVIIALASGPAQQRLPKPGVERASIADGSNDQAREDEAARYVENYSRGFEVPIRVARSAVPSSQPQPAGHCILLTGATGSLGSHLIEQLVRREDVWQVVCVNRPTGVSVKTRQQHALSSRGIILDPAQQAKLRILETDTAKSQLGVPLAEYNWLAQHVTQIVHNAWPMSGSRPVRAFQSQFEALRNLILLARDGVAHSQRPAGFQLGFLLVSSIGVVGHHPLWSGQTRVPEERMAVQSVLDNGYSEAKWVCERLLEATLQQHPTHFRATTVRLGQIAGSQTSGYWNPIEHFAFLVKSAQSLRALPALDGILSWVPVNKVAGTLVDLLLLPKDQDLYPVYHVDNPVGQPWREMIPVLAEALDIPLENVIPFDQWIQRVRRSPLPVETDNPAGRLVDFLDHHFRRMSCGGLLLDTAHSCEHSATLAAQGPVPAAVARKYVQAWKEMGFLHR